MLTGPKEEGIAISGHWLILGGAILWGTTGIAQAFAPAGFDPLVIGTLRLLVGGMALLLLAAPYLLFAWGLRTTEVSTATTLSLAEPMTAAALGIVVLGEQVNLQAGSGIFLIFSGLAVLIWTRRNISRGAIR